MPKKLPSLPGRWTDSGEFNRCVAKAGRAVGKGSPLTDGEIRLLALAAMDSFHLLDGGPVCDESGNHSRISRDDLSTKKSRDLAWIIFRDAAGAGKALVAAEGEARRIAATPTWQVRRRIRWLCVMRVLPVGTWKSRQFDMQTIREALGDIKTPAGVRLSVSDSLIKKAIRLERAAIRSGQ